MSPSPPKKQRVDLKPNIIETFPSIDKENNNTENQIQIQNQKESSTLGVVPDLNSKSRVTKIQDEFEGEDFDELLDIDESFLDDADLL